MSTFDSTKTRLADLLRDIVDGKIQLPDFQRGWVWDDDHILSLLTSIARAFPVGAIMLLESGGETRFKVRPVEGLDSTKITAEKAEKLILDGQQRLTSLTQVLKLNQPVQTRDHKKRDIKRYYYIDIEKALQGLEYLPEAIFSVDENKKLWENFGRDIKLDLSAREYEFERFCFPCSQILNSDDWEEALNAYDSSKFSKYMQFRRTILSEFRNYDIPIIELKKENKKEAVCLVFEKVNTGGVPLSVFELLTATYAADGINLRDEWFGNDRENIKGIFKQLSGQRLLREVEPTEFFQGISLLHTWEKRKEDLAAGKTGPQATGVSAKREAVLSLSSMAYNLWKDRLKEGFFLAAAFLRKESFFSVSDLPYRSQLVPLAAVMAMLGQRWREQTIYEKLARWYWCGVLGELYGSAIEARMALDLPQLLEWIDSNGSEPATVRDAYFQPARLDTLRTKTSAAYKGINVLIQRNGAQDFFWKSTIRDLDENDWQECCLDIHHIFPKAWCQSNGIESKRFNSILNKTPISYKANRMIGGKAPSDYLQQLQTHPTVQLDNTAMDSILKTHCIDPSPLRSNDYDGFVEARRALLLDKISRAMGKAIIMANELGSDGDFEEDASSED